MKAIPLKAILTSGRIHFCTLLFYISVVPLSLTAQDDCRADTSFTDILFVIDNSGSIDDAEYEQFSDMIMATILNVQAKCRSSQIGVMHYGGAFGAETFVEYNFSRINQIDQVQRQYCTNRDQFGICSEGGGDDLNAAMGTVLEMIQNGTLHRNSLNKLAIVIFTDAFGFEQECGFINCSVIRPFTNIDRLKSDYSAQVTVVGASAQAEPSLLALYASPGGTFENVRLFDQDCPSTFDGCTLPRKYIPILFDSPIISSSDSIASCVNCTVEVIGGVMADAGPDQTLCEEEDGTATLTAQLINGTAPFSFLWDHGLGATSSVQVAPDVTTTYSVSIMDVNGCSSTDMVTVFVENCIPDCETPPIITCPADTALCMGSDISATSLGFATALAGSSNCTDPVISMRDSVVVIDSCSRFVYRIWTATYPDDTLALLEARCIQEIDLSDNAPPTFTSFPGDIIVDSGSDCQVSVAWDEPLVADNCTVDLVSSSAANEDIFDLGITYVVYKAIDMCGQEGIDSFAVTVVQQCCLEGPILVCPDDFHGCPSGATDPAMTGMAIGTSPSSLCGEPSVSFTDVRQEPFGACTDHVVIERTWTAIDMDNPSLTTSCIQMLYLLDTISPVLSQCPADIILDPDNPVYEWNDPIVQENCGFVLSYNIANGSSFPIGDTRVVAIATDMCGNQDSCSFIVTVPEEVQIMCPDLTVLRCIDTLLPELIPDAVVTSSCEMCDADPSDCTETTVTIDTVYTQGDKMIYDLTYYATDLCGTDNECSSQIIIDNGPFLDCPDDIVLEAPPYGFDYVSWEKPDFQTCCDICKTRQIDGFLYMGQLGDSYYYCSYAKVNWEKARRLAEEEGGNLVTINSEGENEFIARRLIERNAYIGLSDADIEGSFEWVTAEQSTYRNWKPGQPDNGANEDFVLINTKGYWYDVDGKEKLEFVMEIRGCDQVTQIGGPSPGSKLRVGTTTITYRAEDGCGNSTECSFDITLTPYMSSDILEPEGGAGANIVSITPNPATDVLHIRAGQMDKVESIEIYQINGVLLDRYIRPSSSVLSVDIGQYPPGLHFIRTTMMDGIFDIQKVIIE